LKVLFLKNRNQIVKNFWLKLNKPIIALAPMAGVTDSAFRQICKDYGADVVYSEMISTDGLYYEGEKTLNLLDFKPKEQPVVFQLFGKNPKLFGQAAKLIEKKVGKVLILILVVQLLKYIVMAGELNLCVI